MKWPGHIVLPLSVIPSYRHYVILHSVSAHFLCHILRFSYVIWNITLSREHSGWIWIRVRSNNFLQSNAPCIWIFQYFSVFAHYLHYKLIFWNEIWYIGFAWEYTGWVCIWVWWSNFPQTYALWLRKNPVILSFRLNLVHRFLMRIYRCVTSICRFLFLFGSGRIIFDRVMPLGLRKIPINLSFFSSSPS